MERDPLTRVLTHTRGNKVRSDQMLEISRASLQAKILASRVVIGLARN
jgi:DNA-binding protein Fis